MSKAPSTPKNKSQPFTICLPELPDPPTTEILSRLAADISPILFSGPQSMTIGPDGFRLAATFARQLWEACDEEIRLSKESRQGELTKLDWHQFLLVGQYEKTGTTHRDGKGNVKVGGEVIPGVTAEEFIQVAERDLNATKRYTISESAELIDCDRNDIPAKKEAMKSLWERWKLGSSATGIATPFDMRGAHAIQGEGLIFGRRHIGIEGDFEAKLKVLFLIPGNASPSEDDEPECLHAELIVALRIINFFNPARKTKEKRRTNLEVDKEKLAKEQKKAAENKAKIKAAREVHEKRTEPTIR